MLNQDIYVSNAWVLRKCKETLLMQKINNDSDHRFHSAKLG